MLNKVRCFVREQRIGQEISIELPQSLTPMVLDYSREGMRKVAAQEINSIDGLRKLYANVRSSLCCTLDYDLIYV